MALSDHVAYRIRKARESYPMTREEFAARCSALGWHISKTVILNLETGRIIDGRNRRLVRVDELVVISAVLGVPVLDFLDGARLPPGARLTADDPNLSHTITIRVPPGARIAIDE